MLWCNLESIHSTKTVEKGTHFRFDTKKKLEKEGAFVHLHAAAFTMELQAETAGQAEEQKTLYLAISMNYKFFLLVCCLSLHALVLFHVSDATMIWIAMAAGGVGLNFSIIVVKQKNVLFSADNYNKILHPHK